MILEALIETVEPMSIEFDVTTADGVQKKDTLNIKYRPNAYTPRLEEESAKAQTTNKAGEMLKSMLVPLIADWDMMHYVQETDLDGTPLFDNANRPIKKLVKMEITHEAFSDIPLSVLSKIFSEIAEKMTPGKTSQPSLEGSFS